MRNLYGCVDIVCMGRGELVLGDACYQTISKLLFTKGCGCDSIHVQTAVNAYHEAPSQSCTLPTPQADQSQLLWRAHQNSPRVAEVLSINQLTNQVKSLPEARASAQDCCDCFAGHCYYFPTHRVKMKSCNIYCKYNYMDPAMNQNAFSKTC